MRYFHWFISVITVILFLGCGSEKENKKNRIKTLPVIKLEQRDVAGYSYYPASIEGVENIEIYPKIQGFIKDVAVKEGNPVQKGDLLFQLEVQSLDAEASAAGDAIKTAQVRVNSAQIEVDKLEPLVQQEIISDVELKTARTNLNRAKSEVDRARSSYKSIKQNADYKNIYSPVDGLVSKISYRQGALVSPTDITPLTTVSNLSTMYAYFSMNEKDYINFLRNTKGSSLQEKISHFPEVQLVLADGSLYDKKGNIDANTAQVNPNTGAILFRASFPNPNSLLANGYSGTIKIPKYYNNVLVVPEQSTYEQQTLVYVYKLKEGDTIEGVPLQVAARVDNLIIVDSGVEQGDKIVAEGLGKARDGLKIKPQLTAFDSIAGAIDQVFQN